VEGKGKRRGRISLAARKERKKLRAVERGRWEKRTRKEQDTVQFA